MNKKSDIDEAIAKIFGCDYDAEDYDPRMRLQWSCKSPTITSFS